MARQRLVDQLRHPDHLRRTHAPRRDGGRPETDPRGHERRLRVVRDGVLDAGDAAYAEKTSNVDRAAWTGFERNVMLQSLDTHWREHLSALDHLRQGIHLRGYAQKNPKQEYKRESFTLFQELMESIKRDAIRVLSHVQVRREDPAEEEARLRHEAEELAKRMQFQHADASSVLAADDESARRGWLDEMLARGEFFAGTTRLFHLSCNNQGQRVAQSVTDGLAEDPAFVSFLNGELAEALKAVLLGLDPDADIGWLLPRPPAQD